MKNMHYLHERKENLEKSFSWEMYFRGNNFRLWNNVYLTLPKNTFTYV